MLLDPRAFLGDEDVRMMTERQAWAYLRLLMHQWEEGSIPACSRRLSAILTEGLRVVTPDDIVGRMPDESTGDPSVELVAQLAPGTLQAPLEGGLWAGLKPCFDEVPGDPSRLRNPRTHREREVWVAKQKRMQAGGRKGGEARAKRATATSPPSSLPSSQLEAPPEGRLVLPVPSPVPSPIPFPEKTKSAASPRVSFEIPPEWRNLGLSKAEARTLTELVEHPERIDPDGKRASHVTDEKAMRTERLHLLAELVLASNITFTDTSLQLWCAWRAKARAKAKPRLRADSQQDWRNEVETLRKLRERIEERWFAIGAGELHGWRGFEWKWMDSAKDSRRVGAGSGPWMH